MNLPEPLLSICIPTFERERDLRRCLDSIFNTDNETRSKIEICISDNRSSYNFLLLMEDYIKYKNLRYHINKSNTGFDQNMLTVIGMAKSKYIMLLGNDDIIAEGGISKLLKTLNRDLPDAVFMNYNIKLNKEQKSYNAYKLAEDRSELNLNWILYNLREKSGFISSIVFKRSVLNNKSENIYRFIGTQFIHFAIIFDALKSTNTICYLSHPIVTAFDENSDTYNVKNVFLKNLGEIVNFYKPFYDPVAIKSFKYGVLRHVIFSRQKLLLRDIINFEFITARSVFLLIISRFYILDFAIFLKNRLR